MTNVRELELATAQRLTTSALSRLPCPTKAKDHGAEHDINHHQLEDATMIQRLLQLPLYAWATLAEWWDDIMGHSRYVQDVEQIRSSERISLPSLPRIWAFLRWNSGLRRNPSDTRLTRHG